MYNLLFFLLIQSAACGPEQKEIRILWKDEKAIGIEISKKSLSNFPKDSILYHISVRLSAAMDTVGILGDYKLTPEIQFIPVIPFTRGLRYEVFYESEKIGIFNIPLAAEADRPQVLAFYPSSDTLPENLLKIYLQFSHPMREAQAEKYIQLIKNGKDTVRDVFLYLQPELWNNENTVLTILLDPGRIKRDLQPNLRLGSPLTEKATYQLIISKQWPDKPGRILQKDFTHHFWVGPRDSLSPVVENWPLQLPKAMSRSALQINFKEPLDHFLITDCLQIINNKGVRVKGTLITSDNDTQVNFIPDNAWQEMEFRVEIEPRLEDLAGNNLNRLFDRDITQTQKSIPKKSYRIPFKIKK